MFHNMQKLFVNTSEAQNFITQEVRTCCFPFHIGSAKSEIKMYKILILQPPTANIATVFWFLLFFVFFSFFLLFCDHQPHNWGGGGGNIVEGGTILKMNYAWIQLWYLLQQ